MERFWNKVEKSEGCWMWIGTIHPDSGYGMFKWEGANKAAHRFSYELNVGDIPDGMIIMHICDVRACVNPAHLRLGTVAENNRDRANKKRSAPVHGEFNARARLTDEAVLRIRNDVANGRSQTAIAKEYGVARTLIGMVARGEVWQHIAGPRTMVALPRSNSGYRGVSWSRHLNSYQVYITIGGKRHPIGVTKDAEDGARMFDAKAKELGLDPRKLNFPE